MTLLYRIWATPAEGKPGSFSFTIEFSREGEGTWHRVFDNADRLRGFYEGMFVGATLHFGPTAEVPAEADHPENVRREQLIQLRAYCIEVLQRPEKHPCPRGFMEGLRRFEVG